MKPTFTPLVSQWNASPSSVASVVGKQLVGEERVRHAELCSGIIHLFTATQTHAHAVIFTVFIYLFFIYTRHVNNISQRVHFELFSFVPWKLFKSLETLVSSRREDRRWKNKLSLSSFLVYNCKLFCLFLFFCSQPFSWSVWSKAGFPEPAVKQTCSAQSKWLYHFRHEPIRAIEYEIKTLQTEMMIHGGYMIVIQHIPASVVLLF